MKKLMTVVLILSLFMLSSCAKIEEAKAQEVVNQLFEYIEKGDYDSASALFCSNEDDGKTFSEFLDEVEIETGLDFQSDIEILEYAGLGIAMANASEDVKKHANLVTDLTNEEDGAVKCLLKLIEEKKHMT